MYLKINPKLLRIINKQFIQHKNFAVCTCTCNRNGKTENHLLKQRSKYISQTLNSQLCLHSTQSDLHRQKVVIETSTPKIVLGKLDTDKSEDKIERISRLQMIYSKMDPYVKLARWDRPIGVYLLYWPCAWSIALASVSGTVPLSTTIETAGLFLIGAGLMRGAGCTINDMWDKDIDSQVERTKSRPLVRGSITKQQAWTFLAAQLSMALTVLLQLNCYSVVLGASSLLLVVTYPLAKRFTNYPQLFLGATFNWGALLGYSSIMGTIDPLVCLPLYAGSLAWTVVYDTIYAHQDKEDDARIGIKSTALTFGSNTKPILTATTVLAGVALGTSGVAAGLGLPYLLGVTAFTAHLGKQVYTLNMDNPADCNNKFKSNSLAGAILLLAIMAGGYKQYIEGRIANRNNDNNVVKSCVFS